MSFSFSQNLLSDISSSQSSQSDSLPPTQPMIMHNRSTNTTRQNFALPRPPSCPDMTRPAPTQPMIMHNRSTNSTRQNFTLPRPPSCPDLARPVSSSYQDHQRAKYSRKENSSDRQAGLGQTLREVQTRLSSVPSTFSRMLEEALIFLEAMITKEEDMTSESVMSLRKMLEQAVVEFSAVETNHEEMFEKASNSVELSTKIVNSVSKALVAVDAGQNNMANVIEIIEEKLEKQIQSNKELKKDLSRLNDDLNFGIKNQKQMVREAVKEELERIKKTSEVFSTSRGGGGGGAASSCLGGAVGPVGGKMAPMTPTVYKSIVRGFSLANGQDKQEQAMVDFSLVMEMDEEEEEEDVWDSWEE